MYSKDLIICISCRIGGQNLCGQRAIHFEVFVQNIPEYGFAAQQLGRQADLVCKHGCT